MDTSSDRLTMIQAIIDSSQEWEEWVEEVGELHLVSSSCKKTTGYDREEFLENPHLVEEIVHPNDRTVFSSYCSQRKANPTQPFTFELRIINRSGGECWIELSDHPVFEPGNQFYARKIRYQNITQRRNVEEELRQRQQLVQALVSAPRDIFLLLDASGTILLANNILAEAMGKNLEELTGKCYWDMLTSESARFRKNVFNEVLRTGQPFRVEDPGHKGTYDSIVYPVLNDNGEVARIAILARDITEKKLAEKKIQDHQLLLDALLDGLDEVFVVVDRDGTILLGNQVLARKLGGNLDDMVGKCCWDIYPKDLVRKRRAMVNKVIQTKRPIKFEDQGISRIFQSILLPILDEQGEVEKIAMLSYDLSEIKKTEKSLRESEEKFRLLAENSHDVIWTTDLNMRPIYISPAVEKFRGYSVEEAMQESFESTLTPSSLIKARDALQVRFKKERDGIFDMRRSESIELEYIRKDGSTAWGESNISFVRNSSGVLDGFMGVTRDITKRKRAEEELRRSEQLLRTVVNNSPVIVVAIDQNDIITMTEGKALAALKVKSSDLIGRNVLEVIGDRPSLLHEYREMKSGEELNLQTTSRSGSIFEVHYTPIMDHQNNPIGATIIGIDITEYKRVQDELHQSQKQLEAIMNGVSDGISVIDNKGDLIYANQVAAFRMGFPSSKEMMEDDKFRFSLEFFDEDGNPVSLEQHTGMLALKGITVPPKTYRYRVQGVDQDRWVVLTSIPIFDEDGRVQMVVITSHDISELKRTQLELQEAHDELEVRVDKRTAELSQVNMQLKGEINLRKLAEEEIRRKAAYAEALARLASRLNSQQSLHDVFLVICEETAQALKYNESTVLLLDKESDNLYFAAESLGRFDQKLEDIFCFSRQDYLILLNKFGTTILFHDISTIQPYCEMELVRTLGVRTVMSVPMIHNEELIGCLNVNSYDEIHLPTDGEINLLKGFADQAAIAIVNARLYDHISQDQKQMQAMSERLVRVQEEERHHLARELHDQIGQILTSLNLNLEIISRNLQEKRPSISRIQGDLNNTKVMLNHLLEQIRELSLELRPGILDDLGLLPALVDHFSRYSTQTNLQIDFKHSGLENRFPPDVETAAFRIIQEALTNVARHAGVEKASVRAWVDQEKLNLQVEDEGVGFDPEAVEHSNQSIGLFGMRERASLCGGFFEIETSPGEGVCLTAQLPLH